MKKQSKRNNKKALKPKKGNVSDLKTRKLLYIPKTKLHIIGCSNCEYRKTEKISNQEGCWDCFFTGKELVEKFKCSDCEGSGKYNKKAYDGISKAEKLLISIFGKIDDKSSLDNKKHCKSCGGLGIKYKYPYAMRGSIENTFKQTKKKGNLR